MKNLIKKEKQKRKRNRGKLSIIEREIGSFRHDSHKRIRNRWKINKKKIISSSREMLRLRTSANVSTWKKKPSKAFRRKSFEFRFERVYSLFLIYLRIYSPRRVPLKKKYRPGKFVPAKRKKTGRSWRTKWVKWDRNKQSRRKQINK